MFYCMQIYSIVQFQLNCELLLNSVSSQFEYFVYLAFILTIC